MTEESSALLQNELPPKLQDPGSFSIPCEIGNTHLSRALCDLGASVRRVAAFQRAKLKWLRSFVPALPWRAVTFVPGFLKPGPSFLSRWSRSSRLRSSSFVPSFPPLSSSFVPLSKIDQSRDREVSDPWVHLLTIWYRLPPWAPLVEGKSLELLKKKEKMKWG